MIKYDDDDATPLDKLPNVTKEEPVKVKGNVFNVSYNGEVLMYADKATESTKTLEEEVAEIESEGVSKYESSHCNVQRHRNTEVVLLWCIVMLIGIALMG